VSFLYFFVVDVDQLFTLFLRYKYENEQVIDAASTDASSPLPYQVYGNGNTGSQLSTRGTYDQLLERQVVDSVMFIYLLLLLCALLLFWPALFHFSTRLCFKAPPRRRCLGVLARAEFGRHGCHDRIEYGVA
jgi:hypothetical protein